MPAICDDSPTDGWHHSFRLLLGALNGIELEIEMVESFEEFENLMHSELSDLTKANCILFAVWCCKRLVRACKEADADGWDEIVPVEKLVDQAFTQIGNASLPTDDDTFVQEFVSGCLSQHEGDDDPPDADWIVDELLIAGECLYHCIQSPSGDTAFPLSQLVISVLENGLSERTWLSSMFTVPELG